MNIVFWVKGNRGVCCLRKVLESGFTIDVLVLQAQVGKPWYAEASALAKEHGIMVIEPDDPNDAETETFLKSRDPDLFVLAGYGKILKQNIIDIPKKMCINLHGGKLPEYRGSSPMNWALINGESSFGISIIKVDPGVDTGDVILERSFPIDRDSTIRDLHKKADEAFPELLLEAIKQIAEETYTLKKQDNSKAGYFPLRFPEDGLILWDMFAAEQVHNRIRALTEPYPCAFTYYRGRKVKLISSMLRNSDFYGEPGRVYLKNEGKLLVCAADKCLWITEAVFDDTGEPLFEVISRYDQLATLRHAVGEFYKDKGRL